MIDQILKSVKGELGSKLVSLGLPESKTGTAIKMAGDTVQSSIANQVSTGGISVLTSLFNGKPPLDQSSLVKTMVSSYGSKMVSKLGISESIANSVSSFIIPFIMSKISNKVAGGDENAIMQLTGNDNPLKSLQSFGGKIKSFF